MQSADSDPGDEQGELKTLIKSIDAKRHIQYNNKQEVKNMKTKYDLVGVDGNAFAVMGYTARALSREGLRDLVPQMRKEAVAGDYDDLVCVCMGYLDKANEAAEKKGKEVNV